MRVSPRVYEMISCIWADISSPKPMSSPTRFSSGWKISPPYRDFILSILVELALIVGSAVATMRTAPAHAHVAGAHGAPRPQGR